MDIRLSIISPEGTMVDTTASMVSLPGSKGRFQVLRSHAPLISSLEAGEIRYRSEDGEQSVNISSGFVEVKDDVVKVCAEAVK